MGKIGHFPFLGGRFGYFYFSARGRGKGVRGARKGVRGVGFSLQIPGGGGSARREGEGGAEGPGGCRAGTTPILEKTLRECMGK